MTDSEEKSDKKVENLAKYKYQGDRNQIFELRALGKLTSDDDEKKFNADLFGKMVQKGFKRLWSSKELSDITLVFGKEKVPAHRMVLCAWSETFRAMLNVESAWKESTLKELPIELADENSTQNFKHMLRYMYTGETDFIKGHNIIDIIALSNYYGIESLKELCGELLGDLVSDDNLLFFLDVVDMYDVKQLEAACGEHLAENFGELLDEGKLDELEPSTWAEMLRSDNIQIRSEEQLFEAVMNYADQFEDVDTETGENKRDEVLKLLLPFIRWPFMSPKYLVDNVENDVSLQHLNIVHDLLHEAFRYKVYPEKFSKNIRTRARVGFRFDKNKCHTSITISDDGRKATLTNSGGWMNVTCVEELTPFQNYVEWKIETGGNMMLGAVSGTCSTSGYAGQWNNGWTYYSPGGQIYHANSTPVTGQSYGQGDTIGMSMDFDNGKLSWYKNGTMTVSVTGVPTDFGSDNGLRPIACFSQQNAAVTINPNAVEPGSEGKKKAKKGKVVGQKKPAVSTRAKGRDNEFIRNFLKY